MKYRIGGIALSFFCLLLWQCGYYSFSASLPAHIKTVAIPLFEDKTSEFGVKEQITDVLIEEFTRDNTLKIADRRNADSIIAGTILSIRDEAGSYDRNERVQDLKVYVTVHVKFEDVKKRKTIWEERMTQWGTYDPSEGGAESRKQGIDEAINKLAADILNKAVANW